MLTARVSVMKIGFCQRLIDNRDLSLSCHVPFLEISSAEKRDTQCTEVSGLDDNDGGALTFIRRNRLAFDFEKWRNIIQDRTAPVRQLHAGAGSDDAGNTEEPPLQLLECQNWIGIFFRWQDNFKSQHVLWIPARILPL